MSAESENRMPAAGAAFSVVRVIVIVLIVGAIGVGGWFVASELQGPRTRYKFSGQVMFDGKPVTTGSVMTQHTEDKFDSALGTLDAEGRFSLETNFDPGATEGVHKVVISSMAPGFPPRPLVPVIYTAPGTTPLTINVTSDESQNTVVFNLEGELPAAAAAPAGGPPAGAGGPPGAGGLPGAGGPPGRPAGEDAPAGEAAPASEKPAAETSGTEEAAGSVPASDAPKAE